MKKTIVVIATSRSCGYCRALRDLIKDPASTSAKPSFAAFAARFPGADFVFADSATDTETFNLWMAKGRFSGAVPIVAVFDQGKLLDQFVARRTTVTPWSADGVAARIAEVCKDCVVDGGTTVPEPPSEPSCGGCKCSKCGCEVKYCPGCGAKL